MQQILLQTIGKHTDLRQNARSRRHGKRPSMVSALVMGRPIPLTTKIRKVDTFAKIPQIPKCLGRTLGIGGFLKILGRLKLSYRKFQTAFTGFFGFENKKRLESSSLSFHFSLDKKISRMAEAVRFELTEGYQPSTVFKTVALNRSATLPFLKP